MATMKRCPGCGRSGATCWTLPCLHLETVLAGPLTGLRAWARIVGGTLVRRGRR